MFKIRDLAVSKKRLYVRFAVRPPLNLKLERHF